MEDKQILLASWNLLCLVFCVDDCGGSGRIYCMANFPSFYMMRRLPLKNLHIYVFLSLVVFLGVQTLKFLSIPGPSWVFHHLNDFLAIPMIATICLHAVWWMKNDKSIRLDIFSILTLVILFSISFEYYLPQHSYRYTGDIWDVVCYFLGGVVFYILQKMK